MASVFYGAYPYMTVIETPISTDYDENYYNTIAEKICDVYYSFYPEELNSSTYDYISSIKHLMTYTHIYPVDNPSNFYPMIVIDRFNYSKNWDAILTALTDYDLYCVRTRNTIFISPFDSWEIVKPQNKCIGDDQNVEPECDRYFEPAV